MVKNKNHLKYPHTFVIIGIIILAAVIVLTWIIRQEKYVNL